MIFGNDYWWSFVIALEEKRQDIDAKSAKDEVDIETYEEYVLIIALLGPLYKYLTEGRL